MSEEQFDKKINDGNWYRIEKMGAYEIYDVLKTECSFEKMIILYKLIKHKMETLEDETRNYCECEKDNGLENMINFIEKVCKQAEKEPTLEEELEKERKFINKIKGNNEDEIKEILEALRDSIDDTGTDKVNFINWVDKIEDYITNLQEIEKEHKNCTRKHWQQKCAEHYANEIIYKSRNEKAIDKIQYIIDYGFDYDGFNTVESLKGLIDMLVDYARQSKDILQGSDKDV